MKFYDKLTIGEFIRKIFGYNVKQLILTKQNKFL